MTEEVTKPVSRRRKAAPAPTPEVAPEVAPEVTPAPPKLKTVTSPVDLRVVTPSLVVIRLKANEPRQLSDALVHAAQGEAAKQHVTLKVD